MCVEHGPAAPRGAPGLAGSGALRNPSSWPCMYPRTYSDPPVPTHMHTEAYIRLFWTIRVAIRPWPSPARWAPKGLRCSRPSEGMPVPTKNNCNVLNELVANQNQGTARNCVPRRDEMETQRFGGTGLPPHSDHINCMQV